MAASSAAVTAIDIDRHRSVRLTFGDGAICEFGLEELREKVLCRIHALDDRVIESLKLTAIGDASARLEAAAPAGPLTFRVAARTVEISASVYEEAAARREQLAHSHPALFAEASTWINALRTMAQA